MTVSWVVVVSHGFVIVYCDVRRLGYGLQGVVVPLGLFVCNVSYMWLCHEAEALLPRLRHGLL